MRTFRLLSVLALASPLWALSADPCEAARIRDTKQLVQAIKEDRAMVDAYLKAAQACAQAGAACDQARLDCGALLTSTLQAQVDFDEGWWLRDLMLPYLGQTYQMTKPIPVPTPLTDVTCNLDAQQLTASASRRSQQAERRQSLVNEYPKYARWATDAQQRCKAAQDADAARTNQQKAEAERLAAAAAAARTAEEQRQAAVADAKRKAEEDARRQREAQEAALKKQREEQEAALKKQREAQEEALRRQQDAQERARREAAEAAEREKKERERALWEAQEKARIAEEERKVREREARVEAARTRREQLLAEADAEVGLTEAEMSRKRKEINARLDAEEAAARESAEARREAVRKKAAGLAIDDSHERPRGSIAVMGGGGYASVSEGGNKGEGVLLGAQALLHVGIWGTAPSDGMASGFDIRVLGRFYQAVAMGSLRTIEGQLYARYFFGPVAVGGAGEFRMLDSTVGGTARSFQSFDFGPSVSIAFADTPRLRSLFNVTWLPVGTGGMDLYRVVAEIEASYEWFVFDLSGGTLTDPQSPSRLGFNLALNLGVRLRF